MSFCGELLIYRSSPIMCNIFTIIIFKDVLTGSNNRGVEFIFRVLIYVKWWIWVIQIFLLTPFAHSNLISALFCKLKSVWVCRNWILDWGTDDSSLCLVLQWQSCLKTIIVTLILLYLCVEMNISSVLFVFENTFLFQMQKSLNICKVASQHYEMWTFLSAI